MKLKEKLAEEYCGSQFHNDPVADDKIDCYLAGFEKAREMEADEFGASPSMKEAMLNLGEEEV